MKKASPKTESTRAEKSYWTVKEAARYLNIHYITVYQWIAKPNSTYGNVKLAGDPPPVRRFGKNCIRFPIEEFKEWANNFNQGQN